MIWENDFLVPSLEFGLPVEMTSGDVIRSYKVGTGETVTPPKVLLHYCMSSSYPSETPKVTPRDK